MDDLKRQNDVINMMITMHSVLRDRYHLLSLSVELVLLVSAILLNVLVFVDYDYLKSLFEEERAARFYVGLFSVIVFIISIVMLKVNWKEKSENHKQACHQLSRLLNECRQIISMSEGQQKKRAIGAFNSKYDQVNSMLVPIPDRKFAALKVKHYRKVQLSKLISLHPGKPLILLKLYLYVRDTRKKP